jgi:hypothetical protein
VKYYSKYGLLNKNVAKSKMTINPKFTFVRFTYQSGDWDTDQRMPANLLNSLLEYTTIAFDPQEKQIPLDSDEIFHYPFAYLSGHKLVQFSGKEGENFKKFVNNGGFVWVDDCNHDIDGLFAKSFENEMNKLWGPHVLVKIPHTHPIYSSFFRFEKGPPNTSFELNGWGDDLVHEYLKAIERNGRIGVLYSNKDYGCEWDYDFRNKRFLAEDNTKFGVNIIVYSMES